ncbi:ABC transporter ATP-binding protein [Corynebacterium frankenforstense]
MVNNGSSRLRAEDLTVAYGEKTVIRDVTVDIPDGEFTVIVGPNACGKSTLLKALARLLTPRAGTVFLDGRPIGGYGSKEVARRLSLLPQSPTAPEGIVVEDLVARGRYPHQGLLRQWTAADEAAVDSALDQANVTHLRRRHVSDLSGGQRQRVWLALVLAQQTPVVLLDEPTTYLDITHQVEVLDLARRLYRAGSTVVAVLHELTLAFRYASNLIVMKDGAVAAAGPVERVVTEELLTDVYEIRCDLVDDPESGRPIVVPRG